MVNEIDALGRIQERFGAGQAPLGVASINLDHVHHFGASGAWAGSLGTSVEWLNLIDGAPIASKARRLSGVGWPRLAGSDLIGPILDLAERDGIRVGFLGGSEETRIKLLETLGEDRPSLELAGVWSPSRAQITDPVASRELAAAVRKHDVQLLVVCLGKPRQELWIEANASATGAEVLLAFGAVVDFLAGRVKRAPRWVVDAGLEWAWRLAIEPKRLARRYLVHGPPAYVRTQQATLVPPGPFGSPHG
ncbi:MAG: WecB/TagA/CpsF family glycosyltransferase [Propionibacteriaceae bacterium]